MLAAPRRILAETCADDRIPGYLGTVRQAMLLSLRSAVDRRPVIRYVDDLVDYLRLAIGSETREQFRLLLFDGAARLLSDETLARGTPDAVSVDIRDIIVRALHADAVSLILVHNHPSQRAEASQADIDLTTRVRAAADAVGLRLMDHLIVTRQGCFSFRAQGLL